MKILYRIIVLFGFAIPGLLLGMLYAAKSGAAEGSGLAGGAIVLGYGVVGAFIAAVLGLVVGMRLSETALPRAAGAASVLLVLFVVYVSVRMRSERLSHLDPPEAYAGIPEFSLKMERSANADPVLAKLVLIDGSARKWTTRLPDGRNCSAQASAESLRKAVGALEAFLKSKGGEVACGGEVEQTVTWKIESGAEPKEGSISLNAACLTSEPEAQFLLFALQQVTATSDAPIKCK